ncbi:septation protein SepH [Agromyces larvae]|uniref:Septation protein SepH n=1 Tax=Agromyces larvae TaxID=2929802 RepID=A0ABY4C2P7_9MICO|nr:septation protein SepH [Agromyces larvae]UOE45269.1 septation protein SepH [Agromyces larvae]
MQELKVIGVEGGALVAASEEGARFRIEIDEVLQSRIRQVQPEANQGPKLSPREVQAQIRAGLSADEIARLTGASVDYIRRFEGPVLAEREHVVSSALAVPVHLPDDLDPAADEPASFGSVIRDRLQKLDAHGERWAAWKDEERGWVVKLEFTADTIDHDARWSFDLKRQALQPMNSEAITLSQQRELDGGMIPRLRAVGNDPESKFDSGAFDFEEAPAEREEDTAPQPELLPYGRPAPLAPAVSSPAVARAAIKRADEPTPPQGETADLLEALRRRRGEREAVTEEQTPLPIPVSPEAPASHRIGADASPEPEPATTADDKPGAAARALWGGRGGGSSARGRKGRASMPSWDEIVFGARPDDDLA